MASSEDVHFAALKDFADSGSKDGMDKLESILADVAKTGQYIYPWHYMKHLYVHKLETVTADFLDASPPPAEGGTEEKLIQQLEEFRKTLIDMFNKFTWRQLEITEANIKTLSFAFAPFTIQRISELLVNPRKHYKSSVKFFRGLEKNIQVVSTVDPVAAEERGVKRPRVNSIPEVEQNGFPDSPNLRPPEKRAAASLHVLTAQPPEKLNSIPLQPLGSVATSVLTSATNTRTQPLTDEPHQSNINGGTLSSHSSERLHTSAADHSTSNSHTEESVDSRLPSSEPSEQSSETNTERESEANMEMNLASSEVMLPSDDDTSRDSSTMELDQIVPGETVALPDNDDSTVPDVGVGKDGETESAEVEHADTSDNEEREQMEVDSGKEETNEDEDSSSQQHCADEAKDITEAPTAASNSDVTDQQEGKKE